MDTFETPMSADFAELLLRRDAELRRALQALSADDEPAQNQDVSDFKDLALRVNEAQVDEQQADRLEANLALVAAARQRLGAGRFGTCLDCGGEIDLRRLLALPEAEYCMACQQRHESQSH